MVTAVVADDSVLFRSGLVGLLRAAGVGVLAEAGDGPGAERAVGEHRPDVALVDVRMPPTHTDEGIDVALRLRRRFPDLGVVVLSTYAQSAWVARLLAGGADRLGYLLKDRVDAVDVLVDAMERVAAGGTAVDPEVVTRLLRARSGGSEVGPALARLTPREHDVLSLMAEGLSNAGIARRLRLAPKTVEAHVAHIFTSLGLLPDDDSNRRVRAVVTLLSAH